MDGREQQLLKRLRHHESQLSKIGRSSSADWENRLKVLIEDLVDSREPGDFRSDVDHRRPN